MTLRMNQQVTDTMPTPMAPLPLGGPSLFPNMADAGHNLQRPVAGSLGVFTILATTLIAMRMYCKFLKYRTHTFDDWLLVASWAIFLASIVISLVLVVKGQGKHVWEIPPESLPTFALPGRIATTFYIISLAWSKTSFAITLLRVVPQKIEKWFLYFAIISLNVTLAASALLPWVSCVPLQKSWKPEIPGVCDLPPVDVATKFNIVVGAYSGLFDLTLVFLAWKTILSLQMELREKVAVGLAMSMGIFAAICAGIRCTHLPNLSSPDFTYELSPIIIWSAAEASATIIAACVPSLRVLARTARSTVKDKAINSASRPSTRPSTRPELRSQLSFEKWAMGESEGDKEVGRLSMSAIRVERVIRLDWEPVQMETGDIERSKVLETIKEGVHNNKGN